MDLNPMILVVAICAIMSSRTKQKEVLFAIFQIILGHLEETYVQEIEASEVNWVSIAPIQEPISVTVKLRYAHQGVKATVIPQENCKVRIVLDTPERSASPGQAAVFYQDDVLLGGGWIDVCHAVERGQ